MFSLIYILGVLFFLRSGIRGTKPHSFVLCTAKMNLVNLSIGQNASPGAPRAHVLSLGALRVLHSRIPTGHP